MSGPDAAALTLHLAERLAQPENRTFYGLINAASALRRVGIEKSVLVPLVREAERKGRWEDLPERDYEEILLLVKTSFALDQDECFRWLKAREEEVSLARRPRIGGKIEWVAPTNNRRRLSLWVSIIERNRRRAPAGVTQWASLWAKGVRFWRSHSYACSFDALNCQRFGHASHAEYLARRLIELRDPAGFWRNCAHTLRLTVNLLDAGLLSEADLDVTREWLLSELSSPVALTVRELAWGTEFLWLVGRRGRLDKRSILTALRARTPSQCGWRGGDCENAPAQVEAGGAFHITSFDARFDDVRLAVADVCHRQGFRLLATDRAPLNSIREMSCRWCSGLGRAAVVIADLTALERPNVPFELGWALGRGKQVLILFNPDWAHAHGHRGFMSDIPHLARVEYRSVNELQQRLSAELARLTSSSPETDGR